MNRYDGASAPDRLLVATSSGVTALARESSGAWRKAGTALAGRHATTLTTLPGRLGIFVGTHGDGVLFSENGARWEERDSGLAFKDVYTVALVAEAGGIALYAGTQPACSSRAAISAKAGASFRRCARCRAPNTGPSRSRRASPTPR